VGFRHFPGFLTTGGEAAKTATKRRGSMKKLASFLLLAALAPLSAHAQKAEPTLAAMRRIVGISGVSLSSDGTRVAFIRSIGDYTHDRYRTSLMAVSTRGGTPRALETNVDGLSDPHWSPSGHRIAYIANDAKGTAQIFVIAASGGARRQITHLKNDVQQISWSPSGDRIAYVVQDEPHDMAAFKRHDDLWSVGNDGFLTTYQPLPYHIWVVPVTGGTARRLTHGTWSVMEAAPPFVGTATDPSWSADGRSIAFTMQSDAANSDSDRTSIATVDVVTGRVTKVDGRTHYEYQPFYSQRGNDIAFLYPHGPGPISVLNVYVGRNDVTSAFDRDVTYVSWLPHRTLLMLASDGPQTSLYVQPRDGQATRLALGDLNPSAFSTSKSGAVAFVASTTSRPDELYFLSATHSAPRRLTYYNAPIEALPHGRSVEMTWTAPDGEMSDAVLTYPIGYQPGKKYPLVLRIHGGPESATSFAFEPLRQLFAARGYFVFQPNYRGSDNLGTQHEHAIYKDPGVGPGNDVMAGVAQLEKTGMIDTSRESVTGHSYGGYMTTWIIGHWHNLRSAVVGDGMVDWTEEYNFSETGNYPWARDSLGGSPWDPKVARLYASGSPISYVSAVTTPTLIISGTADETVPVTESYELYHALHDEHVPVQFIAIPTAHHFPSDPVRQEGYYRVTLRWVDRYFKR
jgi:dipeptidyl aminopeptidase/acylaminoacyl peptidase